jgi:hypothetical protein
VVCNQRALLSRNIPLLRPLVLGVALVLVPTRPLRSAGSSVAVHQTRRSSPARAFCPSARSDARKGAWRGCSLRGTTRRPHRTRHDDAWKSRRHGAACGTSSCRWAPSWEHATPTTSPVTAVAPPRRPAGTTPSAAFCRSVGLEDPRAESCRHRHRRRLEATKGPPSPEPATTRAREQVAEAGPAARARAPMAEALDPAAARARAPGPKRRRGSRRPPLAAATRSGRSRTAAWPVPLLLCCCGGRGSTKSNTRKSYDPRCRGLLDQGWTFMDTQGLLIQKETHDEDFLME